MKIFPGVCAVALKYITLESSSPSTGWRFCDAYGFQRDTKIQKTEKSSGEASSVRKQLLDYSSPFNNKDCRFIMDPLLPTDGQPHHYVLIKDLKILVGNIRQQVTRSISRICRNCFHIYSCEEVYHRHIERCFEFEAATIKMPNEKKQSLEFQQLSVQTVCAFRDLL